MKSSSFHLERMLLVVAPQNAGKTTQIRSMYRDVRLGNGGHVPRGGGTRRIFLSNERILYIRTSSPHEMGETSDIFFNKLDKKFIGYRCNFAGAYQSDGNNYMPEIVEGVRLIINRYDPERIRICFLSPDKDGRFISESIDIDQTISDLSIHSNVEVMFINARFRRMNGLLLADYFDFT